MSLGSAMAGGNPTRGREEGEFYPTPADVTWALMEVEHFDGGIWEPACGDGAMSKELIAGGYKVVSSDLTPRGYGLQANFLGRRPALVSNIVTNPPFNVALHFIKHGLSLKPKKLALMLKSTYWHSIRRLPIFEENMPAWIYPLTWRPDFMLLGRPTMEVSWVVWHRGNTNYPRFRPLARPKSLPVANLAKAAIT